MTRSYLATPLLWILCLCGASATISSSPTTSSLLESTCTASKCKPALTCMTVSVCLNHNFGPDFPMDEEGEIERMKNENFLRKKRETEEQQQQELNLTTPGIIKIGVVDRTKVSYEIITDEAGKKRLKKGSQSSLIIESLSEKLGLDYELVVADSWGTVSSQNSGEFHGIIGLVQRKEVDIGLGDFNVQDDRLEAVEFSHFMGAQTFTILMKTPSHVSKADSLIAPFSRDGRAVSLPPYVTLMGRTS